VTNNRNKKILRINWFFRFKIRFKKLSSFIFLFFISSLLKRCPVEFFMWKKIKCKFYTFSLFM
jgi:hypothetical protein